MVQLLWKTAGGFSDGYTELTYSNSIPGAHVSTREMKAGVRTNTPAPAVTVAVLKTVKIVEKDPNALNG